jgi:hypothetical protein
MEKVGAPLSVLVCFLISGLLVHAAERTESDSKALFEKKCSMCHGIDTTTSRRKTPQAWMDTVMRMWNIKGAPLTEEEAREIIGYLSENFAK